MMGSLTQVVPIGRSGLLAIPDQNTTAALIAAQLKFFKFNKTNLNLTATVFPALSQPGRVRYATNPSCFLKVFSNLSWNISFYGNWDNVRITFRAAIMDRVPG